MIGPARVGAYEVLRAVSARRADLPAALARARTSLKDERDRALAGEIATGTLRWQGTFDRLVSHYAQRPLSRMDPEVVDILRLTIFQLLHLDRVPASAAVNDAVDLTRKVGKKSAAPLVNAILRKISRERHHLPLPPRVAGDPEAELDFLEHTLSHPRWLAERWRSRHGFDSAEAWCRFNNAPAPLTLRANRLKLTRGELAARLEDAGIITEPCRFAADGLFVREGNPLLTPLASSGLFVVQDEASQLVAAAAGVRPGQRVLDACAAPGGKTTAMAAAMEDRGVLVAADVRDRRVRLLADTVRASGARSVRIVQANVAGPVPFQASFDCVLIDAPCSGLGTIRRDPDIKWRRSEAEFESLADLQLRILTSASAAVRPGGRLLYSTCSTEPEENEAVVERFLEQAPEFAAARIDLPGGDNLINEAGQLRTLPFRDTLEGFFAALLVKRLDLR